MSDFDLIRSLIDRAPSQNARQPVAPFTVGQRQRERVLREALGLQGPEDVEEVQEGILQGEPSQRTRVLREAMDLPEQDRLLIQVFNAAVKSDPTLAGEAQRLGIETGVSPEVIERNIDKVRQLAALRQFRARRLAEMSPVLREQMSNPDFAKLAHDDFDNLSNYDKIAAQHERGQLTTEFGDIESRIRNRIASANDLRRREQVQRRLSQLESVPEPTGVAGLVGETLEIVGQMQSHVVDAVHDGLAMGITGAGATAAATLATGPGALGTPLTASGGFGIGFVAGSATSLFDSISRSAGGHYYRSFLDAGLSEPVAATASRLAGAVEGSLELVGIGLMAEGGRLITGPLRNQIRRAVIRGLPTAMRRPTTRAAGAQFARDFLIAYTGEIGTELLQNASGAAIQNVAQALSNQTPSLNTPEGREQFMNEMVETLAKVSQGMVLLALPGPTFNFMRDARSVQSANQGQALYEGLRRGVTNSKVRDRNLVAFQNFLLQQLEGRPGENIYIDSRELAGVLSALELTGEQIDEALPGVREQISDALSTGGDVVIPTADISRFVGSALEQQLRPHIRLDPESPSLAQLDQAQQVLPELTRDLAANVQRIQSQNQSTRSELRQIQDTVRNQLISTRQISRPDARLAAQLFRTFVEVQSRRLGVTPTEFVQQFDLQILGEQEGTARLTGFDDFRRRLSTADRALLDEIQEMGGFEEAISTLQERAEQERQQQEPGAEAEIEVTEDAEVAPERPEPEEAPETPESQEAEPTPQTASERRLGRVQRLQAEFRALNEEAAENADIDAEVAEEFEEGLDQPERLESRLEGTRGTFFPAELLIVLRRNSDLSTVLHEFSHYFFTVYEQIVARPDAPQEIVNDFETFLESVGVESIEAWQSLTFEEKRPHTETFAINAERYFFEGNAPSKRLERLYETFRRWVLASYQQILQSLNRAFRRQFSRDLPALNDEVRGVMDRMFASQEAVEQAEAVRGMLPLFIDQETSGMSPERWAEYQRALQDASDEALAELASRHLRDVQFLSRFRGQTARQLQRRHDNLRKETREQVAEEVRLRPVYRLLTFLRKGELLDSEGNRQDFESGEGESHKLNTEAVRDLLPPGRELRELPGLTNQAGQDPEIIAAIFQFDSGRKLVLELLAAPPIQEEIDNITDIRMLEEHGDLVNAFEISMAVEKAVHNKARTRVLANEVKTLTRSGQPVRVIEAAARQAARRIVMGMKIRNINIRDFIVAEARASREAMEALSRGDTQAAVEAKRAQLLQNQLVQAAVEARQTINDAPGEVRKIWRSDTRLAATRNMDFVQAARAVAVAHGMGTSQIRDPIAILDDIRRYEPELYEDLLPRVSRAMSSATGNFRDLQYEEFLTVMETIQSLFDLSRAQRVLRDEQQAVEQQQIKEAILAQIDAPEAGPPTREPTAAERRSFGGVRAGLSHAESLLIRMDGGKPGVLWKWFFNLVRRPFDNYLAMRNDIVREARDRSRLVNVRRRQTIDAPELNFKFKNKGSVIGAVRHMGTRSNFDRLLQSYGWSEEQFLMFFDRMIEDGVLTEADLDYVQWIWDTYDRLLPLTTQAHQDVYGVRFAPLPKRPFVAFGKVYRGGYVPLTPDPDTVASAGEVRPEATGEQAILETSAAFRRSVPSTGRSFAFERASDRNIPLRLDLGLDALELDQHLRFIHLQAPGRQVFRLLRDPDIRTAFARKDRFAVSEVLEPYLRDTLQNRVMAPGGNRFFKRMLVLLRRNMAVRTMFANLRVALQQYTGLSNTLAVVDRKYVRAASARYLRNPRAFARRVTELSDFMSLRLKQGLGQITDDPDVITDPSWLGRVENWTQEHAFFLQQFFQSKVDLITWGSAYDQAFAENPNLDPEDAVNIADAAVRRTQASGLAPDISKFERGDAKTRLILQFSSFWITTLNLIMNAPSRSAQVRRLAASSLVLGLGGAAIAQVLEGGWSDDDEDGAMWDDVTDWAFGETLRTTAAIGAPVVGPAIFNVLSGDFGGRVSFGAAISGVDQVLRGLRNLPFIMTDPDRDLTGRDVRDFATLITLWSGVPVEAASRPAQFLLDRDPFGEPSQIEKLFGEEVELGRGLVTGRTFEGTR